MEGKVVVITGATGSVGYFTISFSSSKRLITPFLPLRLAAAFLLAEMGATLVIGARDLEKVQRSGEPESSTTICFYYTTYQTPIEPKRRS
jgi:hypothetical protein